jgi:RNA polymerase sigma factor (sigma-70 family)
MAGRNLEPLIQRLCRAVGARDVEGVPDSELLERFVGQRDEAAYELILRRHAGMVMGLCRRILADEHEAEDAFQAVFLALARKAGSIRKRGSLTSWLYKVAYRTALTAKGSARPPSEPLVAPPRFAGPGPSEQAADAEFRQLVDAEVSRLPEKQRLPILLCYMKGRTSEEAARELGCPVGTIDSRLARARDRLRDRLSRRGVLLSAGAVAAGLTQTAQAGVREPVVIATVKAAGLAALGKPAAGAVGASVTLLADKVLKALWWTRVKIAASLLAVVGLLGAGAGLLTHAVWMGHSTAVSQSIVQTPGDGAGEQPPAVLPRVDFRGAVVITQAAEEGQKSKGVVGWVMLEDGRDRSKLRKAAVRITSDTIIEVRSGKDNRPGTFEDLKKGAAAEVTFAPPVPEGFPLKGTASRMVIVNE